MSALDYSRFEKLERELDAEPFVLGTADTPRRRPDEGYLEPNDRALLERQDELCRAPPLASVVEVDGLVKAAKHPRPRRNLPESYFGADYPRRGRGAAATRLRGRNFTEFDPSTDYPRRGRGAARTRLRGRTSRKPTSQTV